MAAGDYGLGVIDVSDPANPAPVGRCDTPGHTEGVTVSGDYAYLADWQAGLRVVDVSNPANPVEVGYYDTPGNARGVAVSASHAYLADFYHFEVFDCSAAAPVSDQPTALLPTSFALMSPQPNPCNSTTSVAFDLPQGFEVNVYVYDVYGRLIMTDALGMLNAGCHRYLFNGSDLPSGTYFFRLDAEQHSQVRKVLLVK